MAGLLSLRLFGPFDARLDDAPIPALPKKTQALITYLAIEGPQQRTTLATLLWGDTGDDQALQSLRKALSGLRQALKTRADSLLIVQERTIALNPRTFSADVIDFERLAADARVEAREEAAALYRGPLVLGLDVDEAPFNEWLLSRRERYREWALQLLAVQLDRQVAASELERAIDTAARILSVEPLHEPAHRALINLFGRQERRSAAARQYQICADLLWRELGVRPQPATEAAYHASLATGAAATLPVDLAPGDRSLMPVAVIDPLPTPPASELTISAPPVRAHRRVHLAVAGVLVSAIAAAAVALFIAHGRQGTPLVRRSIAILPMKNLSGQQDDDWLSTALTETIGAELTAGGSMRLVSAESLQQMRDALSPPAGIGLTRKQLDEIGQDLGCELVLTGNYLKVGSTLRVDIQLDNVATGEAVATVSTTDQVSNLLAIVGRAGDGVRDHLQLAPASASGRRAVQAAFPSPAAMREYFAGLAALRLRDGPRAADLLQQATTADPGFALAHAALSNTWKLLGYDGRAADEAKRARDLAGGLSPEDRLEVEGRYDEATFNWPAAVETYGRLWKAYHDNIEYGLSLANVLQIDRRLEEAQAVVDDLRHLPPPDSEDPRIDLMESTIADAAADRKRALEYSTRAADEALARHATVMLARARLKQGIDQSRVNELGPALERMAESRALFESLGDRGGVADAIRWEGAVLRLQNRVDEADAKLATALEMSKALRYIRLTTEVLLQEELAARQRDKLKDASTLGDAALASAREGGDPDELDRAVAFLAPVAKALGDYAKARRLYGEWLELNRRLGVPLTGIDNNTAVIDLLQGHLDQAGAAFESMVATDRKTHDTAQLALHLGNLAIVRTYQDDLPVAERLTAEACAVREKLAAKPALAACRVRLALLWAGEGHVDKARAAALAINVADLEAETAPWWDLARFASLLVDVGDRSQARAVLAAADRLAANREFIPDQMIQVTLAHARLAAATGRTSQAAALFGRAERDADRFGLVPFAREARQDAAKLTSLVRH